MKQKGRTPPPAQTDHATQLRERLGRIGYEQWRTLGSNLPMWDALTEQEREIHCIMADAIKDAIVKRDGRMGQISVSSTFGYATQKPYVELSMDVSPAQFSPAKAREIALMLLEAADASESDSVLMTFAREQIGLDDVRAAQLLDQFRRLREQRRGSEVSSA